jgi:hypothetical protein
MRSPIVSIAPLQSSIRPKKMNYRCLFRRKSPSFATKSKFLFLKACIQVVLVSPSQESLNKPIAPQRPSAMNTRDKWAHEPHSIPYIYTTLLEVDGLQCGTHILSLLGALKLSITVYMQRAGLLRCIWTPNLHRKGPDYGVNH